MSNCNGFQMEQDSTKSIGAQQVNCFFSIQNTHPPQLYSDAFGDLDVQCGNSEVNQTAAYGDSTSCGREESVFIYCTGSAQGCYVEVCDVCDQ